MKVYLRYDNEMLEDAIPFASKAKAVEDFRSTAEELFGYGQTVTATLHIADSIEEVVEYPDFALSLNERGTVVCEKC